MIAIIAAQHTQEYALEKDKDGKFVRTVENVQQSFDFTVRLNDGVSRAHHVEVVPRPTTASIECEQVFPAYTRLPNAKRSLGDLTRHREALDSYEPALCEAVLTRYTTQSP